MSDTILSGRWTVYYLAENRQKRLVYTGGGARDSVKDIYLALMDLYHNGNQMDDGSPMQAATPVEYKIGRFDAGDKNAMFVDPTSVEFMYGGSLKTEDWKHVTDDNIGVVRIGVTNAAAIVVGDIGLDISGATDGNGTLLAIQESGTAGVKDLWIRPDSAATADEFLSVAQVITVNAHTGDQDGAAQVTGEMNWANLYNDVGGVASLVSDTHLAIYQGVKSGDTAPDAIVLEYDKSAQTNNPADYWDDGTFDIMLLIADVAASLTTQADYVDEGYATVIARQYAKTYSFNIASLYPGGRNPIGMETGNDLNNNSGYGSVTLTGIGGNWNVGDEILGADTGARAIITSFSSPTIQFYYVGKSNEDDGMIPFDGAEAINNQDDTGTSASSGAVTNVGPAALSGLSVVHANTTADVDQNGTDEYYSIEFDVSDETLEDAFEWAKYTYRRGNRATTHADGIEAEQYIGSDYRILYSTISGSIAEGDVVTGATSGAVGTVVAHHLTPNIAILRNSRGTFQDGERIYETDGVNEFDAAGLTVAAISPIKACPLGTFAGGLFFFAPGVVPLNRLTADANNYQTIDDYGNTEIAEPVQITITAGNTRIKDWITVHRMTASAGEVEKTTYTVDSGGLTKGGNTVVINEASINTDEPGKASGGILVINDVGTGAEHVYHFSSWVDQTFTLDQTEQGTATGGSVTQLVDSGGLNLRVGEIVRDTDNDEWAYVTEVVDGNTVNTTEKATSWADAGGVAYVANDLVQDYDSLDKIYVPLIYVYETVGTDGAPGSASVAIVFDSPFYALLRARAANDSAYKIKPFALELTIDGSNKSQDVIRTTETITS